MVIFVSYCLFYVFDDCCVQVVIIFELFGVVLNGDFCFFVDEFVIGVFICVLELVLVVYVIDQDCFEVGLVVLYVGDELLK